MTTSFSLARRAATADAPPAGCGLGVDMVGGDGLRGHTRFQGDAGTQPPSPPTSAPVTP
jgi:hypothetical protein